MNTRLIKVLYLLFAVFGLLIQSALGTISFVAEGTSAKGVDIRFEADLTISGDVLTVVLTNNSPVDSLNPDDLLASFYFDIVNGDSLRPLLTYQSAAGDTYKGVMNGADILLETDADIQALASGDGSWQLKAFDDAYVPYLGFGLGTVGNSNLSPNGFDGIVVDGINFAIYKGEITTQPLTNPNALVKETAAFVFSGLTGFTENDIVNGFAFGLGTAPDSLLVPEPATLILLAGGAVLLLSRRRHTV